MTGAELALIIGILSGFATCGQYATQLYGMIKQKRKQTKALRQAKQLGLSLQGSKSVIQDEIEKLRSLWHIFGPSRGV
jgi:hypothetical protein